jgi:DnaJ family protein A protein 5
VKFIRKRDPRYKSHLTSQANIIPSLKTQPSVHVSKQKADETYIEQEWQKVDTSRLHADLEWAIAEGDDLEEWECVACKKTFRSDAAWNSHERSKKHIKEVERLKREMEQEDEELDLDPQADTIDTESNPEQDEQPPKILATLPPDTLLSNNLPTQLPEEPEEMNRQHQEAAIQSPMLDLSSNIDDVIPENPLNTDPASDTPTKTTPPFSKRDKRRARKEKKGELGNAEATVCDST